MEKPQEQNSKKDQRPKSLLWDCGSSLYDSFELNSFHRQLDSAINSRTNSMPRLSDPHVAPPPPASKKSSKISRSLNKLLRSVFRPKPNSTVVYKVEDRSKDGFFVPASTLPTIPETPEIGKEYGGVSSEFNSIARRTVSERFTATSIGISCA